MERKSSYGDRHRWAEVMHILRCPGCGGKLREETVELSCHACGQKFPAVNGVIRFVPDEGYTASFGFEWSRYARTQLDHSGSRESEETFRRKTGFSPEALAGKWVLDVGCGTGRFAEVASRWGANVVAVDLSRAVFVAAQNLAERKNVWVFQANLFYLPFAPESFDYIYSIGVLHHTPNCERAFKTLPRFLKPKGRIAIWVYSAYNKWYRMSDFYRRFTSRLPPKWLHPLCQVAGPLYYVHRGVRRIPVLGRFLSSGLAYILPMSLHPVWEWRVLDTFDWYSPTFQSKHTYEEVFRWFEDSGLGDLRVLFEPVAVQGKKPIAATERRSKADAVMVPRTSEVDLQPS